VAIQSTHLILQEISTVALHLQLVEILSLTIIILFTHSIHLAHLLQPKHFMLTILLWLVEAEVAVDCLQTMAAVAVVPVDCVQLLLQVVAVRELLNLQYL
jgi:hypothetical protein